MLFNSYEFVLVFLPLTLAAFYLLGSIGGRVAVAWLCLASFIFYAYWHPIYVLLLVASVVVNFAAGRKLAELHRAGDWRVRPLMIAAVGANIAALAYFKYTNFVVDNVAALTGIDFTIRAIVLPIGISFYTFQQIAYVVDAAHGRDEGRNLIDYSLFVSFFPQLIAGPIVHHREVLQQFANPAVYRLNWDNIAAGIMFFVIGLFKKVVIADTMAGFSSPVFAAAAQGAHPTLIESWGAALAYTLQLYFDFSGYSDMAIGLGLMFNIRLPVNFNSPYKAVSIIEFWRRWHITLSRFLRDYLYVALGGNRRGPRRRYVNIFLTMLLGGIWHGAGWTFALWGALHGTYLVINHLWRAWRPPGRKSSIAGQWLAWALTLLALIVGWVIFRAETVGSAWTMLRGMAGANGVAFAPNMVEVFAPAAWLAETAGIRIAPLQFFYGPEQALLTACLLLIVLFAPNSQQIMGYIAPNDDAPRSTLAQQRWSPSRGWAVVAASAFIYTMTQMSEVSEFLYFQF
ncbi:MAG TPA: MBOAT family protein [Alphaproteobacteria bacterium]|nr:MBOAT family protein [Alphaproteobacteria bacterium]